MKKLVTIAIIVLFSGSVFCQERDTVSSQISQPGRSCKKRELQQWELLSQEGKFGEAIVELQKQIDSADKKSAHRDYWHLGQLYAFNNAYPTAIIYLKKSTSPMDLLFDKYWRFYYKGTIAFLQRDKDRLFRYHKKMQKVKSAYYEGNASALESLYVNFGKEYLEAYNKQ